VAGPLTGEDVAGPVGYTGARRLLVVEDDEDFAETLEHTLRNRAVEVRRVREASEVAAMLEVFPATVALVDVRLARSSGLDVVADLKAHHPSVLTVVMTAYVAVDTAVEALRRGAYDYLSKPFHPRELFATLDRCFERMELERARVEADAARRASEAQLRALFENSLDLVAVVDPAGVVKFMSPAVTRLLGYQGGERRPLLDFVHPDDRERAQGMLATCELATGATCTVELQLQHRDTSWRWFEVGARGLHAEPAIGGVLLCARDVTERRAMEERLRQAQRLEAVGQLTGGVAHDFNNLLAVVVGNLDLLRYGLQDRPDDRRLVEEALQASERGATLVRRLLAFARRQTLTPRPLDPNALVTGAIDLLSRAVGPQVEVETALARGIWHCAVDAGQLETALLNLAINARDAMPSGGRLTITSRNVHLEGEHEAPAPKGAPHVCLSISDTGTGMTPDVRDRVFEPFFSTKGPGQGTGLGLSMVFGFVKQSNGQIRLASQPGAGTTVSLYFPRVRARPPAAAAPDPEPVPRAQGEVILLVEDDDKVRPVLQRLLEELGYEVTATDAARAALDLLTAGLRPHLLVTDVALPARMNGFELAREARRLLPGLRILYASGYAQAAGTHRPPGTPEAPFLHKPFLLRELATQVRLAIDR
jgi:PAS domain S-box-containing protein